MSRDADMLQPIQDGLSICCASARPRCHHQQHHHPTPAPAPAPPAPPAPLSPSQLSRTRSSSRPPSRLRSPPPEQPRSSPSAERLLAVQARSQLLSHPLAAAEGGSARHRAAPPRAYSPQRRYSERVPPRARLARLAMRMSSGRLATAAPSARRLLIPALPRRPSVGGGLERRRVAWLRAPL